jgi:diaminohydroxyphosphoribosylaminopyrimidine deaminase/5-amino-6-(5-phosphoribosylamino)uracil reductase
VTVDEQQLMARAIELGEGVRCTTAPNPWVGAVVVDATGTIVGEGATAPVGGPHAEVTALAAAGAAAAGGTVVVTLEPCSHVGLTGPCTEALIAAGVRRVVVGIEDPDPKVAGSGTAALRAAGVDVAVGGPARCAVERQLAPYLTHRRTGRPFVVLKLATTLDGRTAAPDGTSKWITGPEARADVQRLRAESDAVLVGAGTVRSDDPALTVRGDAGDADRQPLRVVLGQAPTGSRMMPALELAGDLGAVLDDLGGRGVLQVLVEGGSRVAHALHAAGLVDRYVFYVAPAFLGGDDGRPVFDGPGAVTMAEAWRGELVSVARLGEDLRVEVVPRRSNEASGTAPPSGTSEKGR